MNAEIEKLAAEILKAAGECSIQLSKWENTAMNVGMTPAYALAKAIIAKRK